MQGVLLLNWVQIKGERTDESNASPQSDCQGKARGHGYQHGQEQDTLYAHVIATSQWVFLLMALMSPLSDQTCLKHPEDKSTLASASAFQLMLLLFLLSIFLP